MNINLPESTTYRLHTNLPSEVTSAVLYRSLFWNENHVTGHQRAKTQSWIKDLLFYQYLAWEILYHKTVNKCCDLYVFPFEIGLFYNGSLNN